jgi:Reverse transcriptase (RNA-dependent DNA polymerase)
MNRTLVELARAMIRNFRFLTQTTTPPPTDDIGLGPLPEGENTVPIPPAPPAEEQNENGKRTNEYDLFQRRTRGKQVDYQSLNDPFPDEIDEQGNLIVDSDNDQIYAIIAGDEHNSLKEAKASFDWPEWQRAMDIEHEQHLDMGTWKLVDLPPDAVPIANKWVYIKKRDKLGKLIKYKARLVAKGCSQCPGYNYVETFSPVVCMETVHAILALMVKKRLKTQQMDIKGAYLNGVTVAAAPAAESIAEPRARARQFP